MIKDVKLRNKAGGGRGGSFLKETLMNFTEQPQKVRWTQNDGRLNVGLLVLVILV